MYVSNTAQESNLDNRVVAMDEIRQDGKTVLSSDDGVSIPMIFRNLSGKNFSGKKYRDYLKYVAYADMGFVPGTITLWHDGLQIAEVELKETTDK